MPSPKPTAQPASSAYRPASADVARIVLGELGQQQRRALDIATLGCSVNVKLSSDKKTVEDVRVAYGVAGPVPMRAPSAEAAGKGQPVSEATIEAVGKASLTDVNPRTSWRASKEFRLHLVEELTKRAMRESILLSGGVL